MGENSTMSPADIAALTNNGMGNEGSWIWFLLIFVLLGWGGGYGNRGAAPGPAVPPNVATQTDVQNAINNQSVNNGIQQLLLSSANNNYETAQLISQQTNALTQQNYNNQINAIQGFNNATSSMTAGFNNVTNQIMNQTNALANRLDQLGYQMENCCCSIKTQMLNDRLDDRNRELSVAQNALNNANQTQTILANLGRFVAWEGTGSQTAGVSST